jgi:hypothetical protein
MNISRQAVRIISKRYVFLSVSLTLYSHDGNKRIRISVHKEQESLVCRSASECTDWNVGTFMHVMISHLIINGFSFQFLRARLHQEVQKLLPRGLAVREGREESTDTSRVDLNPVFRVYLMRGFSCRQFSLSNELSRTPRYSCWSLQSDINPTKIFRNIFIFYCLQKIFLLTNYRIFLEKFIVTQLVKKSYAFTEFEGASQRLEISLFHPTLRHLRLLVAQEHPRKDPWWKDHTEWTNLETAMHSIPLFFGHSP